MNEILQALQEAEQQLTAPGLPWELGDIEVGGRQYRGYSNAPSSMRELLDAGRAHGEACFIQYQDDQWSFDDFFARADAVSQQLRARFDIQPGDRIAIAMRNYPEWMTAYVGIVNLGAVVVPLNSWGQAADLEYGLRDCGASLVFCDEARYRLIDSLLPTIKCRAVVARSTGDLADEAVSWETLMDAGMGQAPEYFERSADDAAMIMYTSGTTGNPKGAVSSHHNICQAITNFEYHATQSAMANPEAIEQMFAGGFAPNSLLAVPLFHVSGCYALFLLSLRGGRKLTMMYKWDAGEALKLIESERITALSAAPSMVLDVLEHPEFENTDTSSLFALGAGGSACPPKFRDLITSKFDAVYAGAGFGMTESNASCSNCVGKAYWYKPTSSGIRSPITEFKTVDSEGNTLPAGEQGEICIRGPMIAQGYWNKPEATAETFVDGWLHTGDVGYIDDEDFVFVVDRIKDMVIRGGENIYCIEVESCLSSHPAIQDVAAFGLPHDSLGEELAVAIYPKPKQSLDAEGVQAFAAEQLAHFKVPSHVFISDEPLARNATGKLLKNAIKASLSV